MRVLPYLEKSYKKDTESLYSGQALLIILLVLAVTLTVVLSSASRSVTDVRTTTLEEDALRAFSAAEVGVEEALVQQADPGDETLDNDASYTVDYNVVTGGNNYVQPVSFLSGDAATFWFVTQRPNGDLSCLGVDCARANRIQVCWGESGTPNNDSETPAIEVSVYFDTSLQSTSSQNFSNVQVRRVTADPYAARRGSNRFQGNNGGTCTVSGKSFAFRKVINFNADMGITPAACLSNVGCLLMAKVRILYNETDAQPIGAIVTTTGGTNFPSQGASISSVGTAGDSARRIDVFKSYKEVPSVFDSAIFVNQSITHE